MEKDRLEAYAKRMAYVLKYLYDIDKVNYGRDDYEMVQEFWLEYIAPPIPRP